MPTLEGSLMQKAYLHRQKDPRFRILTEVIQQITSILDINELLVQVVRLIQQTFDYYHVGIGLIEGDEVVYRVGAGALWDDPNFQFKPARLKVGSEGITGWVAKTGEPALIPDVNQDSRYVWMQGSFTRSELTVPIITKGRLIGVLDAQSQQPDDFNQADLELMQAIASQTGIAMENARLFFQTERRAEQFRVLTEVSQHITSLTSVDELLGNIARTVKESFGYSHVGIGLVEGNEVVSRAEAGVFEETYRSIRIPRGHGIWGWVAQHGRSLVSDQVTGNMNYEPFDEAGIHSHVCVPLKVKGIVIGVMSAASDRAGAFDQSDEIILQTLANQASVAIENARLHEQEKQIAILEERQRLARELHDSVTQSLYGINLYAEAAGGQIAIGQYDQVRQYLTDIQNTAQDSLAEMRLLIYELRPPVLKKEGLVGALQNRLYSVENRAGLKPGLKSNLGERLPPDVEEGLYRIALEALNNTLKHARAKSVQISILQDRKTVTMEISDDGIGFEPESACREGCLGMISMQQRALVHGWHFTLDSSPGKGTRIRVEVEE
jgi:signal transduction histidine kinase